MSGYRMQQAHPFYDLTQWLVESEIHMSNTVCFSSEVDLTRLEADRALCRRCHGRKIGYTAFVLRALARALMEHPHANRRLHKPLGWPFRGLRIQQFLGADISVAAERKIPGADSAAFFDVLRDSQARNLIEIQDWLDALATCDETNNQQWREFSTIANRFPRWLAGFVAHMPVHFPYFWNRYRGGAALISSPSKFGVDVLVGAWPAPLGVSYGLAKDRAVVRDGRVVPCRTFSLILNFDRRIMAGAQAARFFKCMVDMLEQSAADSLPSEPATARPTSQLSPAGREASAVQPSNCV